MNVPGLPSPGTAEPTDAGHAKGHHRPSGATVAPYALPSLISCGLAVAPTSPGSKVPPGTAPNQTCAAT